MPGPDRHIPKYRHDKPQDLAVVRIGGHDHDLGQYDSPERWEKYHRLLGEHATKRSVTLAPKHDGLTVNELILLYWRHVEAYDVK